MKNACVIGGGPGGLYSALLLKKLNPDAHIVLYEKNLAGATYGWGVVFSDRTLTSFREADLDTYENIIDTFVMWDAIDVRIKDVVVRCEGQVFSGIARKTLLGLLQQRCADLGVELHWETEIVHTDLVDEFELVVAADGVHSLYRDRFADTLKPRIVEGASRYIWFGTDRSFDSFTFCFRETEHGLFQAHAYPFEGTTGTFIVECRPEVWKSAGLDRSSEQESIAFCQKVFEPDLSGASLMSNNSKWLTFPTLKCKKWRAGNVVFIGDAIHTAHFSIGSGTKLAMEDAIGLADACRRNEDIDDALAWYEMDRRPRVEAFQEAARQSQGYFENTSRYMHLDPLQFSFNLLTRSGRVGYGEVRLKDPNLVAGVDALLSGAGGANTKIAPPPAFNPLRFEGAELAARVALTMPARDDAVEGVPGEAHLQELRSAASSGPGLVLTDVVAVSPEARITSGSPGLYNDEQQRAWTEGLRDITGSVSIALHLGHAGARGATAPRTHGADMSLGEDGWELTAASEHAYAPEGKVARAMDPSDMERVVSDFVSSARRAAEVGFHVLGLEFSRGYLVHGFLSPLTNRRDDEYGGDLEARARWPLELFSAVRNEWTAPLFATVSGSDWARGGAGLADAVTLARMLKDAGCDFLRISAGQTTFNSRPRYDPHWQLHFSDVIRNEARIPTMPALSLPTVDSINTIVGGGRADLASLRRVGSP